ncbi:MAG: hypothetical protein RR386_03305, partial [Bacteroidaceae bacterium]
MKNKSIVSLLIFLMGLSFTTSSCSDMLTPDLDRFSGPTANNDTLYRYWGILKSVQNIAERYVILGESRSDLSTPTQYTSDSINSLMNFENPVDGSNDLLRAADYYYVINQCNSYLQSTDSSAVKDGNYYMRREYAQVQAVRAWVYLQLVQNYGSVPFVTNFVEDSDVAIQLMTSAPKATKDNLAELLLKEGLARAEEWQDIYGYLSYGEYSSGAGASVNSTACNFPIDAIMGDLYLLKNDYETAARKYYKFMKNSISYFYPENAKTFCSEWLMNDIKTYSVSSGSYLTETFNSYTDGKDLSKGKNKNENLTLIPSASNSTFGTVLTRVQNIYGFSTESRQNTTPIKNPDGTTTAVTSGSISVEADETYRQIAPSPNYQAVSDKQVISLYTSDDENKMIKYAKDTGDGRIVAVAPKVSIDGESYRFIAKYCPPSSSTSSTSDANPYQFSMHYAIPIYRKALIYLRYAEAINRAGFPEHAFALLRDGLSNYSLPFYSEEEVEYDPNTYEFNAKGDTISVNGEPYKPGMTIPPLKTRIDTVQTINTNPGGTSYAYYISPTEGITAQKTDYMVYHKLSQFDGNTTGIHCRGCGRIDGFCDTVYTYSKMVAEKMAENKARKEKMTPTAQKAYYESLLEHTKKLVSEGSYELKAWVKKDLAAEIKEAVEDIIVDELALETCFEGNRYQDLMRISNHKTDGNEWFAWKIARRNNTGKDGLNDIAEPAIYNKLK